MKSRAGAQPTKPNMRPAPHGAGGLKCYFDRKRSNLTACPAPHGAGGLKFPLRGGKLGLDVSRPARGGWVEISVAKKITLEAKSRPARGGWVEIAAAPCVVTARRVPPRTGRVG